LRLTPDEGRDIVRIGEMIKAAAKEQCPIVHPDQPGFDGVTIAQLSGPPLKSDADWQNAVVVSTGELDWNKPSTWTGAIDRSPCGTGTCAKMATLYAKGKLSLNQDFRHAGVLGTVFTGRLVEETRVGKYTPSCRHSAVRRGSLVWQRTSSIRTIHSRTDSRWATSGRRDALTRVWLRATPGRRTVNQTKHVHVNILEEDRSCRSTWTSTTWREASQRRTSRTRI
jgi:hypothetical protein